MLFRSLIERVTDSVYGMFGDARLVHLPGGVDEYLARAPHAGQGRGAGRGGDRGAEPRPGATGAGANGGAGAAESSGERVLSAGEVRAARKELARLERQLGRLEQREAALHGELAEHATDYLRITELDEQLRAVRAEREQLEEAWLALAERVPPG